MGWHSLLEQRLSYASHGKCGDLLIFRHDLNFLTVFFFTSSFLSWHQVAFFYHVCIPWNENLLTSITLLENCETMVMSPSLISSQKYSLKLPFGTWSSVSSFSNHRRGFLCRTRVRETFWQFWIIWYSSSSGQLTEGCFPCFLSWSCTYIQLENVCKIRVLFVYISHLGVFKYRTNSPLISVRSATNTVLALPETPLWSYGM